MTDHQQENRATLRALLGGADLVQLRQQAGYSQRALAELVGVSRAAISRIEGHDALPSARLLSRLFDALLVRAAQ